jgi:hypothetical protein
MIELTQDYLKEQLNYEPTTGLFTRKVSNNYRVKVGDVAGSMTAQGYRQINFNGKVYKAHRLAFLWMNGEFPTNQVDHINHNRLDNRWINLRVASQQENQRNASMRADNKSGFTGVGWHKRDKKWGARIRIKGKNKHLGYFTDLDEAINARKRANVKHNFHQNHGK